MRKFWKILGRIAGVILIFYIGLVIYRSFYIVNARKTEAAVAKIHATKLTLDDVMGTNLPPDPGEAADDTVEGVDVNENGIRDDVELAIFEEYPNSAKTRAVLLQYALALQMEMTQEIVNTEVVNAAVQQEGRAYVCIEEVVHPEANDFDDILDALTIFVKDRQLNIEERILARKDFYEKIGSYELLDGVCDINLDALEN